MAIISDLLRIIAKPIILKLGKGLKSSKTKYCLGEELDIRLDIDEIQLSCDGNVTENAFPRWNEDGKCLKDSKTIQQDNGITQTTSDETSYLFHQMENTKSENFHDAAYEAVVQSPGGNPILRLIRRLKQTWTIYSAAEDDSFRISGLTYSQG